MGNAYKDMGRLQEAIKCYRYGVCDIETSTNEKSPGAAQLDIFVITVLSSNVWCALVDGVRRTLQATRKGVS